MDFNLRVLVWIINNQAFRSGCLVQIQHFEIPTTDDKYSRRTDTLQRVSGKVWSTARRGVLSVTIWLQNHRCNDV